MCVYVCVHACMLIYMCKYHGFLIEVKQQLQESVFFFHYTGPWDEVRSLVLVEDMFSY